MNDPHMKQIGRLNMLNFLEAVEGYALGAWPEDVEMAQKMARAAGKDVKRRGLLLFVDM